LCNHLHQILHQLLHEGEVGASHGNH
jgi:hypothetical protein